jgi:hypothetical protein
MSDPFYVACYEGKLDKIQQLVAEGTQVTFEHVAVCCLQDFHETLEFLLTKLETTQDQLYSLVIKNISKPKIVGVLIDRVPLSDEILSIICEKGYLSTFKSIYQKRSSDIKASLKETHVINCTLRGHLELFKALINIKPISNQHLYHVSIDKKECKIYTPEKTTANKFQDGIFILPAKELINISNYLPGSPYYVYQVEIFPDTKMALVNDKKYWQASKFRLDNEKTCDTMQEYYNRYFIMDPNDHMAKWMQFETDADYQTEMLKQNGLLIEWIKDPSIDQCKIAIEQTPYAVCLIENVQVLEDFIKSQKTKKAYFYYKHGMPFNKYKELFHK